MVSTSIPDSLKVKIKSRFGNFNTGQVYAAAGQSNGRLGYLLEYHSNKSDGFKKLKNLNTGFDITDLMGKIRFLQKKNLIFRNILSLNIIIMMKYQMKRI